jgi:hypothetical protein
MRQDLSVTQESGVCLPILARGKVVFRVE